MKRNGMKYMIAVLLIAALGFFVLMPVDSDAGKIYIRGIFSLSGPDWTCWCKDEIYYDCFCIIAAPPTS